MAYSDRRVPGVTADDDDEVIAHIGRSPPASASPHRTRASTLTAGIESGVAAVARARVPSGTIRV